MVFRVVLETHKYPNILFNFAENENAFLHHNSLPATDLFVCFFLRGKCLAEAENSFCHANSVALLLKGHVLRPVNEYLGLLDLDLDWFSFGRGSFGIVNEQFGYSEPFHQIITPNQSSLILE